MCSWNSNSTYWFSRYLVCVVLILSNLNLKSQNNDTLNSNSDKIKDSLSVSANTIVTPAISTPPASIECKFVDQNIDLTPITAISNLLKLQNNTANTVSLSVSIKKPSFFRSLFDDNKIVVLNPGDSAFLPVRMVAGKDRVKGGVKYSFTALIKNLNSFEIYKSQFYASKTKLTKLKISVDPGRDIYFLNNKNSANFAVNLSNEGEYEERILMKIDKTGKNIIIKDSTRMFNEKNYHEYNLRPNSDTTIYFKAQVFDELRNSKRLDTYGYALKQNNEAKRSLLFIKGFDLQTPTSYKTQIVKGRDTVVRDVFKVGKSVQLIKLSDIKKVNETERGVIPLTLVANAFNLLNNQPSLNILLFGTTRVEKNGTLSYYLQNNFNYFSITRQSTQNTFGQLTFNNERVTVMVGNAVRLNLPAMPIGTQVSGTGVSSTYRFKNKQAIGVALSRNGRNFNNFNSTNISAGYGGEIKKLRYGIGFLNTTFQNGNFINLYSASVFLPPLKNHRISLFGSYYNYRFFNTINTGEQAGFSYNIRYLKNKAYSNLNVMYSRIPYFFSTPNFNALGGNSTFNAQLNNVLRHKQHYFNLLNRYMIAPTYSVTANSFVNNTFINNDFLYSRMGGNPVRYTPGIYFNYTNVFSQEILSGGLIFNVMSYNINENFRMSLNTRSGYNKVINNSSLPNFFTSQVNFFTAYKVFRMNVRYIYGPQFYNNITSVLTTQQRYSQILFSNISHQHQFKNKKFILENTLFYNYINLNRRNGLGWFGQLFYYTWNGWNFNIAFNLNYNISDALIYSNMASSQTQVMVQPTDERRESLAYQLSIGAKKDFSIPLPSKFLRKKNANITFKAFLDINGNRLMDKDEIALSNIIIKIGEHEVQTNEKGEATLVNLELGKHPLIVFPIESMGPWFCVTKDTINNIGQHLHFIPFSKGAEISGMVELERTDYSKAFFQNLDVSRFRITLTDSAGFSYKAITDVNGKFSFFVPYGKYVMQFNEKMLGKDFTLNDNYIEVELSPGENAYFHTFIIVEKQKKVKKKKFDADGNLIEDKSD